MRSPSFVLILIFTILCFLNAGIGIGYMIWHNNNPALAPTYALDCIVDTSKVGATGICYPAGEFSVFWQEATKNTLFTIDGKPVEITDVQVFYKYYSYDEYRGPPITCPPPRLFYGNITYYPSGIENSQAYDNHTSVTYNIYEWNCKEWIKHGNLDPTDLLFIFNTHQNSSTKPRIEFIGNEVNLYVVPSCPPYCWSYCLPSQTYVAPTP